MGKREEVGKWDGRRVGGEKDLFPSWADGQAPAEASEQAPALLHTPVPAFPTALFALPPITTTKTPFQFFNLQGKCPLLQDVFLGLPSLGMRSSFPELPQHVLPPLSDTCFPH